MKKPIQNYLIALAMVAAVTIVYSNHFFNSFQYDDTHTIILAGLGLGDQVIDGPYNELENLKHEKLVKDQDAPDKDDSTKAGAPSAEESETQTADGASEPSSTKVDSKDKEIEKKAPADS